MIHRRLRRLSLLFAALLLLQPAGVAIGHHGGRPVGSLFVCERPGVVPPRCTSVANDLEHGVFLDSTLTDGLADALRRSMAEDYDPTDLRVFESTELTEATDVIASSQDYGDLGAAAWVYCPGDAPQAFNSEGDRWCRMQELRFNLDARYAIFFDDDGSRDHVACHELGHTIGLLHWGNPPASVGPPAATCMNADTPNGPTGLHQIDIDHINAYHYVAPPPSRRLELVRGPAEDGGPMGDGEVLAMQVERHGSLAELTRASAAVVHATVLDVRPGRVFGDPSRDPLHYAAVSLRMDELMAGSLPALSSAPLTLEVPLFDGPDAIADLRASLVDLRGVFFLRSKGASARAAGLSGAEQHADAPFHRLVVFGAMVIDDEGTAAAGADEGGALAPLDGVPFADAVERIRRAEP